jgi:hypothetical protein
MAIQQLTAIGWGLVMFAIVIGLGLVVLAKLGEQITGTANSTVQSVIGYMGTSGLAGWIPVIIVVLVAGLIMALFGGRGKTY